MFPSFTRVFKSVFFYFILHSCVSVSSAPPALFSEASCSSPVLYLSFLVLSLTLDFGFWTLDIILSKLTFCYSTCLPASVSALVTGFIASNKRISLLWIPLLTWTAEKNKSWLKLGKETKTLSSQQKWRHRLFQKTPPKQQMFYALTAATEIYNSFGRHRRNMFSRSSIRSTNWFLNVVLEVKNDPCVSNVIGSNPLLKAFPAAIYANIRLLCPSALCLRPFQANLDDKWTQIVDEGSFLSALYEEKVLASVHPPPSFHHPPPSISCTVSSPPVT